MEAEIPAGALPRTGRPAPRRRQYVWQTKVTFLPCSFTHTQTLAYVDTYTRVETYHTHTHTHMHTQHNPGIKP